VESDVTKTLADAKPEIEKKLRPEIARAEVDSLRKGESVQMDEAFFGPPTPAAPPPGAAAAPAPAKAPTATK
jgi:hypothetical protein